MVLAPKIAITAVNCQCLMLFFVNCAANDSNREHSSNSRRPWQGLQLQGVRRSLRQLSRLAYSARSWCESWGRTQVMQPCARVAFLPSALQLPRPKQKQYPIALKQLRRPHPQAPPRILNSSKNKSPSKSASRKRRSPTGNASQPRQSSAISRRSSVSWANNPLPTAESFPERLLAARKMLGLSQRRMAEKLGVDPATVLEWETGQRQSTKKNIRLLDSKARQRTKAKTLGLSAARRREGLREGNGIPFSRRFGLPNQKSRIAPIGGRWC
jgi:ribosome-binding protein aMBF1 (putative translation factor)